MHSHTRKWLNKNNFTKKKKSGIRGRYFSEGIPDQNNILFTQSLFCGAFFFLYNQYFILYKRTQNRTCPTVSGKRKTPTSQGRVNRNGTNKQVGQRYTYNNKSGYRMKRSNVSTG